MIQTDQVVLQHQIRLKNYIFEQIAMNAGKITFAEFMQHALYAPGLGYYSAGSRKFAAGGDFITAPEIGSLFAKCVTRQISEILNAINAATILEIGAGSGKFACDFLRAFAAQDLQHYYILELSADLRQQQQDLILQQCPQHAHLVKWIDQLQTTPFNGVIFANEVLDAMPSARFHYADAKLQEYYVINHNQQFKFTLADPTTELAHAFAQANIAQLISQPYTSEINLYLAAWIKSLAATLNKGAILLCDYGFPRHEYYHPQRNNGTLMCHYQHRCHDNPLINIGLQDITAHVDFTSIAEAAVANDLTVAGYSNQASFLLNCGLVDFVGEPSLQQSQEINTLTSAAEMGELFKFIALLKSDGLQLQGFSRYDKSHTL